AAHAPRPAPASHPPRTSPPASSRPELSSPTLRPSDHAGPARGTPAPVAAYSRTSSTSEVPLTVPMHTFRGKWLIGTAILVVLIAALVLLSR
ncbi:MAG: hypothetical protein ABW321_03215, partial [Polyangiales bacterium]